MKERPILFNGEMVRAILDGRKTQTRRAMKPQPEGGLEITPFAPFGAVNGKGNPLICRYGQPGDRLWVRETHAIVPRTAYARSDGVQQILRPDDNHDAAVFREGWEHSKPGRWRPSIHMPRWASRILLEVTDVRVERLQDISAGDALAEGCYPRATHPDCSPLYRFSRLWRDINGEESWHENPWVWVVEFRRIE